MNKIFCLLVSTVALFVAGCCSLQKERARALDIKFMTFNIRNGLAKDGENHWNLRKDFVSDIIREYAPDALGVQEAFRFQLDELNKRLPEYGELGIGRDGGDMGEYSAILFRKERFDVEESGTFWLSETPSEPSAHWGNNCRRVCTWARLTEKSSARSLYIYNTHLDHQSQSSREKGVRLIMKRIQERTHQYPFVLMGDFNVGENNPVIFYLKGISQDADASPIPVVDAFRTLYPDEKAVGTYNQFTGYSDGAKIDYIFVTPNTRTLDAAIVRTNREGRYPSDHYPVTARLLFE
ncbi:endonuclease/exonuclease/phosphatase family protein [Candidatus Sumerlaeota bacterium]|nr:endonuclease/exonuclease/phosphatase family protein [Candidatus Sumerlaeota bacterium]